MPGRDGPDNLRFLKKSQVGDCDINYSCDGPPKIGKGIVTVENRGKNRDHSDYSIF